MALTSLHLTSGVRTLNKLGAHIWTISTHQEFQFSGLPVHLQSCSIPSLSFYTLAAITQVVH